MKIIELIGLPGAGKTTLINSVMSNRTFSATIVTRSDLFKSKLPRLWLKQYLLRLLLYVKLHYITRKSNMMQQNTYINRLIKLLVYFSYYEKKKNDYVLLLDEGIIQYITSLEYEHSLPKEILPFAKTLLIHYRPVIIDCQIPLDTVEERIRSREKTGDRYYLSDDDSVRKLLQQKRDNLDFVITSYSTPNYTFNMTHPLENLVDKLFEIVEDVCEKD